ITGSIADGVVCGGDASAVCADLEPSIAQPPIKAASAHAVRTLPVAVTDEVPARTVVCKSTIHRCVWSGVRTARVLTPDCCLAVAPLRLTCLFLRMPSSAGPRPRVGRGPIFL